MHVIACPNHPPVISWPHEFQHLLLFVLGWRKVNWELHVGWRLRVACMWFDASKKHSLPIWPRFSISLRSWDTGSATPCEDDHVTKKIRPNPSN